MSDRIYEVLFIADPNLGETDVDKLTETVQGWAEKDGAFVNHAGLAQPIVRGLRGPGDARPDGRILWELAGRTGLFRAAAVRQEIAKEIAAFAALSAGDLGDHGVSLTTSPAPVAERQLQSV